MHHIKVSPSILSADFANLGSEIQKLCASGADFIHVDVMDGNFVPNITIGPCVIKAIKPYATIPLDVHLMIEHPEKHIDSFIEAGSDIITFHLEPAANARELVKYIKAGGVKAGLSLQPGSEAEEIFDLIEFLDLILIMTVEPGFGGQEFMQNQLDKIRKIKYETDKIKKDILISVDGGINDKTAKIATKHGANMLVSGNWLFKQPDITKAINTLKS